MSVLPPVLGKRGREARRGRRSLVAVAPIPYFSVRRMTRSAAKASGYKPTSSIPTKTSALRRPRAKKAKPSVDDSDDHEDAAQAIPPPTPIADLQAVGARLGISVDHLTLEKLTAPPKKASSDPVSDMSKPRFQD